MENFDFNPIRFANYIAALSGKLSLDDPTFKLAGTGRVSIHWAPFEHKPERARLVLVGITPGRQQATNALSALQAALRTRPLSEAMRIAKQSASFSGAMRGNLVRMLDAIGVPELLDVTTCADLFKDEEQQVHFTSALRYPVLLNGANYNGTPDMLRTPLLRDMVETCLAGELRALEGALVLPLGPKPTAAVRHLVAQGVLPVERVLEGMPHPSGANGERISYFLEQKAKDALSSRTSATMIDQARARLRAQIRDLRRF